MDAALVLFGQKGYAAVSVREICRLAKVSAPTIYYYYGNKRGLYDAILLESTSVQRTRLQEALEGGFDCLTRLKKIAEAWLGLGAKPVARELRLFYLREAFGLGSSHYVEVGEDVDRLLRHAIRDVIQEGVDSGLFRPVRPEMVALTMIATMNTFLRRIALGARLRPEEALNQIMDTTMFGVLGPEAREALTPAKLTTGSGDTSKLVGAVSAHEGTL